ncbi:hypothetical protein F5Y18DRAFT_430519 [Xylariaceae sp. FL1019]|nr:hypothetical protein F5Y18DRAFT_430519 [Xylariaceae sp. FL1019]
MGQQSPAQDERLHLSKPQVFVHLSWGLSWSDRHVPRSHTLTYTSKNLKNARESGLHPRQVVPANTNYLIAAEARQHRRQDSSRRHQHYHHHHQHHHYHYHSERHQRDSERPRGRPSNSRAPDNGAKSEARCASSAHERGSSAPPPVNDSPWDEEAAPSATIFPRREQRTENPSQYRLGEDSLPWTADAWPSGFGQDDDDDDGDGPHWTSSHPTTVPLSLPSRRRGVDDPERTRELESLSTALMTVDNGFENQWWNQGARESTTWIPPKTDEDDARPLSPADALLLSAAEPPSVIEPQSPNSDSIAAIVSPLSEFSVPSLNFTSNLQRSFSTRSDELWIYK